MNEELMNLRFYCRRFGKSGRIYQISKTRLRKGNPLKGEYYWFNPGHTLFGYLYYGFTFRYKELPVRMPFL